MSNARWDDAALSRAFREPPELAALPSECPAAGTLVRAANGDLMQAAELAVLDHVAACPACTVAWLIARDTQSAASARTRNAAAWQWMVAAAAVVAVVVGGWSLRHVVDPVSQPPLQREVEHNSISSQLVAGTPLEREQFTLRWSPVPGATYDLTVSDEDLAIVFAANGLTAPQAQVPAGALDAYASGRRLLWQVTAVLENGKRIKSTTFSAALR